MQGTSIAAVENWAHHHAWGSSRRTTMGGLRDDSTPQQTIRETYSEWLNVTGRDRCNYFGVLFARQVTNQGQERFEGLTEDEVCKVIDCNPNAAD